MMRSKEHISAAVPSQPDDKEKARRMIALAKAMKAHSRKPLGGMKEDSLKAGKRYA
jgi:hypothetical protein